jgi:HSP20 family molecular chaperone IbpA
MSGRRRHLGDLQGEIQDLFADLWEVPRFSGLRRGFRPQCDCYRTDDPPALHLVLELPGVDPDAVRVSSTGTTLVVAGVRVRPHPAGARYQQLEIEYGPFERRIELAEDVDSDGASVTYEAGMLRLEVPLTRLQASTAKPPSRGQKTTGLRRETR